MSFKEFIKDENGLTSVEYAIAGAFIAASFISIFVLLGSTVITQINRLSSLSP